MNISATVTARTASQDLSHINFTYGAPSAPKKYETLAEAFNASIVPKSFLEAKNIKKYHFRTMTQP